MIVSFASAIVLGVVGSTHCAAMCGPLAVVSRMPVDKRRLPAAGRRASMVALQNAGRLASYAAAGGLAGGFGRLVEDADRGRWIIDGAAALLLILAGATLAGLVPARASLERVGLPLWRRIQPLTKRWLPVDTPMRALFFGLAWGFVPCGLVYSALSLSLVSGSIVAGAATMLAFGLGTAPALMAIGVLANALVSFARRPASRQIAGAMVIVFGLMQTARVGRSALQVHAHTCCHAKR